MKVTGIERLCSESLGKYEKPFYRDGWRLAVNSHCLFGVRASTDEPHTSPGAPDVFGFAMRDCWGKPATHKTSLAELKEWAGPHQETVAIEGKKSCPECGGEGQTECPHCCQEMGCDTCGGSGLVATSDPSKFATEDRPPRRAWFGPCVIDRNVLSRALQPIFDNEEEAEVSVTIAGPLSPVLFMIGDDVLFVVMPMLPREAVIEERFDGLREVSL